MVTLYVCLDCHTLTFTTGRQMRIKAKKLKGSFTCSVSVSALRLRSRWWLNYFPPGWKSHFSFYLFSANLSYAEFTSFLLSPEYLRGGKPVIRALGWRLSLFSLLYGIPEFGWSFQHVPGSLPSAVVHWMVRANPWLSLPAFLPPPPFTEFVVLYSFLTSCKAHKFKKSKLPNSCLTLLLIIRQFKRHFRGGRRFLSPRENPVNQVVNGA